MCLGCVVCVGSVWCMVCMCSVWCVWGLCVCVGGSVCVWGVCVYVIFHPKFKGSYEKIRKSPYSPFCNVNNNMII